MLAVPLPVEEVQPLLPPSLSVATINADDECVVAGPLEDIEILAKQVATDEIQPTLIPLDAAGHSSLLDPILPDFLEVVRRIELLAASDPVPLEPHRHVDHARAGDRSRSTGSTTCADTVRFADCLRDGACRRPARHAGDGSRSLAVVVRPAPGGETRRGDPGACDTRTKRSTTLRTVLLAAGRAWAVGIDLDVARFAGSEPNAVATAGLSVPPRASLDRTRRGSGRRGDSPGSLGGGRVT